MKKSIEELFVQVEREHEFDSGYNKGYNEGFNEGFNKGFNESFNEGKNQVIAEVALRMLRSSVDDETILKLTNCSRQRLQELKRKMI